MPPIKTSKPSKTGMSEKAAAARRKQAADRKKARAAAAEKEPPANAPKGKRGLTNAQKGLRDSLMVARVAQGWTYEEIAAEAEISVSAAKRAVIARRDAMPVKLNMDPAEIIERVFEGYQLSIADFERIAAEAGAKNQLAVAVGAKKGANEAREKTLALLQATNRLPQELGALRHLIDLRAIAVKMLDTMDRFQAAVKMIEMTDESRVVLDAEVRKARATFGELIGLEEEQDALPSAA